MLLAEFNYKNHYILGKGVAAVYDKEGHIMGSRQVRINLTC